MLHLRAWQDYKLTQKPSAKQELIKGYLPLVTTIAGRVSMKCPSIVDYGDLVGWGVIGLIESIDRFDPDKGVKFETFAKSRIRGAMMDGLREMDWVTRSTRKKAKQVERAYRVLERKLGRAATDGEVACELGVSLSEFHRVLQDISQGAVLSLDEMIQVSDKGETVTLLDAVPDSESPDPYLEYEAEEMRRLLAKAIDELPQREKLVITLHYYDGLMIKEIADLLGITDGRVSQLHTQATLRLRARLSNVND
ncbi:MAG: FliA/WhiG family RNA polymerase sigma factor [Firmicutes bacterium]|nr:FliA/WhiG family RNA polymerase sigma factor [Bacillota bacterium]HXL04578.1 FliA/WhiG family RNA polymerase sigma factor [Bacillota bacterium]